MSIRSNVIAAARAHLGEGPRPEWHGLQWCGLFALTSLHEADVALDIDWKIGKGSFVLLHPEAFPVTRDPQPGDIGVQNHDPWHHVIVTERSGDVLYTIAGNTGHSPGVVGVDTARLSDKRWVWYSIEPIEAVP